LFILLGYKKLSLTSGFELIAFKFQSSALPHFNSVQQHRWSR
jgi:hypothetical protein